MENIVGIGRALYSIAGDLRSLAQLVIITVLALSATTYASSLDFAGRLRAFFAPVFRPPTLIRAAVISGSMLAGATYVFSYVTVSEMEEYPDSRETLLAWGRMFQYTNTVLPWMRAASWFPYFVGSVVEPDRRWQFVAMALLAQSGDPVTWFFYDKAVNELRTLRMHSLVLRDWALPDYVLTQDLIMRWSTWSTLCSVGPLVVAWLGLGYIEEYAPGSEQQQQANGPGAAAAQGGDAPSPPQSFYSFAPDPPVPTPPASRRSNSRGSQASNNAASGALNGAAPGALNGAAPGGGAAPGAAPGAAAFGGGAAPGAAAPGAAFGGAASPRAASSRAASEQAPSQQQDQDLGWLDELYPQAP